MGSFKSFQLTWEETQRTPTVKASQLAPRDESTLAEVTEQGGTVPELVTSLESSFSNFRFPKMLSLMDLLN